MQKRRATTRGSNSPEQSSTPEQQLQQMLQLGQEAAQLLQSPVFNWAHQQAMQVLFQEWAGSEAKEVNKRESLHATLRGANMYTSLLVDAVEAAQKVQHQQADKQDEQRVTQDYLDQQGFGLDFGPLG